MGFPSVARRRYSKFAMRFEDFQEAVFEFLPG
jgi:hypothetical protein